MAGGLGGGAAGSDGGGGRNVVECCVTAINQSDFLRAEQSRIDQLNRHISSHIAQLNASITRLTLLRELSRTLPPQTSGESSLTSIEHQLAQLFSLCFSNELFSSETSQHFASLIHLLRNEPKTLVELWLACLPNSNTDARRLLNVILESVFQQGRLPVCQEKLMSFLLLLWQRMLQVLEWKQCLDWMRMTLSFLTRNLGPVANFTHCILRQSCTELMFDLLPFPRAPSLTLPSSADAQCLVALQNVLEKCCFEDARLLDFSAHLSGTIQGNLHLFPPQLIWLFGNFIHNLSVVHRWELARIHKTVLELIVEQVFCVGISDYYKMINISGVNRSVFAHAATQFRAYALQLDPQMLDNSQWQWRDLGWLVNSEIWRRRPDEVCHNIGGSNAVETHALNIPLDDLHFLVASFHTVASSPDSSDWMNPELAQLLRQVQAGVANRSAPTPGVASIDRVVRFPIDASRGGSSMSLDSADLTPVAGDSQLPTTPRVIACFNLIGVHNSQQSNPGQSRHGSSHGGRTGSSDSPDVALMTREGSTDACHLDNGTESSVANDDAAIDGSSAAAEVLCSSGDSRKIPTVKLMRKASFKDDVSDNADFKRDPPESMELWSVTSEKSKKLRFEEPIDGAADMISEAASVRSTCSLDFENENDADALSDFQGGRSDGRSTPRSMGTSDDGLDSGIPASIQSRRAHQREAVSHPESISDKFGKFEIDKTKPQQKERGGGMGDFLSDTWSVDAYVSEEGSEPPPESNPVERLSEIMEDCELGGGAAAGSSSNEERGAVGGGGSSGVGASGLGAGEGDSGGAAGTRLDMSAADETGSDTWSVDVAASEFELTDRLNDLLDDTDPSGGFTGGNTSGSSLYSAAGSVSFSNAASARSLTFASGDLLDSSECMTELMGGGRSGAGAVGGIASSGNFRNDRLTLLLDDPVAGATIGTNRDLGVDDDSSMIARAGSVFAQSTQQHQLSDSMASDASQSSVFTIPASDSTTDGASGPSAALQSESMTARLGTRPKTSSSAAAQSGNSSTSRASVKSPPVDCPTSKKKARMPSSSTHSSPVDTASETEQKTHWYHSDYPATGGSSQDLSAMEDNVFLSPNKRKSQMKKSGSDGVESITGNPGAAAGGAAASSWESSGAVAPFSGKASGSGRVYSMNGSLQSMTGTDLFPSKSLLEGTGGGSMADNLSATSQHSAGSSGGGNISDGSCSDEVCRMRRLLSDILFSSSSNSAAALASVAQLSSTGGQRGEAALVQMLNSLCIHYEALARLPDMTRSSDGSQVSEVDVAQDSVSARQAQVMAALSLASSLHEENWEGVVNELELENKRLTEKVTELMRLRQALNLQLQAVRAESRAIESECLLSQQEVVLGVCEHFLSQHSAALSLNAFTNQFVDSGDDITHQRAELEQFIASISQSCFPSLHRTLLTPQSSQSGLTPSERSRLLEAESLLRQVRTIINRLVFEPLAIRTLYPCGSASFARDRILFNTLREIGQQLDVTSCESLIGVPSGYSSGFPWSPAVQILSRITYYKIGEDLVECVHQCTSALVALLENCPSRPRASSRRGDSRRWAVVNSDQLLPAMACVITVANPPLLFSLADWMKCYAEVHALSGPRAYSATTFLAALNHLKILFLSSDPAPSLQSTFSK